MSGNVFRPSSASPEAKVVKNFFGHYPTEDWWAQYWDVTADGSLARRKVTVRLPLGFRRVSPPVAIGQPGCIYAVRRWGLACRTSLLQEIPFDPAAYLSVEATDEEVLHLMYTATWFDLPGYFIIASDEHPFYLYDPDSALKGTCVDWFTYLGALTYLYTDGDVKGSFVHVFRESASLYRQALAEIQAAWGAAMHLPPDGAQGGI
jgi:hypothetical protein